MKVRGLASEHKPHLLRSSSCAARLQGLARVQIARRSRKMGLHQVECRLPE